LVVQEVLADPSYQIEFLVISFIVSVLGSFAALTAAGNIRGDNGRVNNGSLLIASLALGGVAIWSMHFVGMMAYRLPVTIGYAKIETLVSLVAAVAVAWFALRFLASGEVTVLRVVVSGVLTGLGVVVMHYLGMYGMRFSGFFVWDYVQVGVSVAIALVAATTALWLAFSNATLPKQMLAAVVMGVAVCAMHYTGMDAASAMCRAVAGPATSDSAFWYRSDLQVLVPIFSLAICFLVIFDRLFKRLSRSFETVAG